MSYGKFGFCRLLPTVYLINRPATRRRTTGASFPIGVQCRVIIERNLLTRADIAQRQYQDVIVNSLHIAVGFAGVVDVVGAISASAAIQTPAVVDFADA